MNNREGCVVWFTGLPCSGKTTVADNVAKYLDLFGVPYERLDGDDVRETLSKGLTFTRKDRDENLQRVGFVARRLARQGVVVLCTFVSPYVQQRLNVAKGVDNFIQVFVNTDEETCMTRDVKGMWKKAINKEILNFTGYSAPYERPYGAQIELCTVIQTVEQSTDKVLRYLKGRGLL
jgi:adenylylsulfate kinase